MYRWYGEAGICIAYLEQVCEKDDRELEDDRYFSRGWTLQELIAPKENMSFYDKDWQLIGDKVSLLDRLSTRTDIPGAILNHCAHPKTCSVAQRMSWAANRKTSRIEDRAYSLLGLFEVSLEMVYGEGERAFLRLQRAILQESSDQTIFAWTLPLEHSPSGLLAPSPDAFADCGDVVATDHSQQYSWENVGLVIELPTLPYSIDVYAAFLSCQDQQADLAFAILVARLPEEGQWARVTNSQDGRSVVRYKRNAIQSAGTTRRRIRIRQEQYPSPPPIGFRRTNGFWLRTLAPPHHGKSNCHVLSYSGLIKDDRVHLPAARSGTAAIARFTPHKGSSSWSHIRWIYVGFDDEFTPMVMLADDSPVSQRLKATEGFRRVEEAGVDSAAQKLNLDSDWIKNPRLIDEQEQPTFKNAWRGGYYIQRGEHLKEGESREYTLPVLNVRIRMSLLEDIDPLKARGAVIGPMNSPRYIWTVDIEEAEKSFGSPESRHCAEICLLAPKCLLGLVFAPFMCCMGKACDDFDEVCCDEPQ